jgi:NitT/TauT family transport system substrate-binding protein
MTKIFMRCLLVAAGAVCAFPALAADQVTVQLDYEIRGNHGMFFLAKSEGLFAKEGIDVTAINKGQGSVNTMRIIGSDAAEFGFGDLPTLIIARSQNTPVVAIAAVNQQSPMAMISLAKSPLKTPKDLEGRAIGVFPAGSTFIFMKAFTAANHLDMSKIEVRTITPPSESFLLLNRVDVIPGYIDAEVPELEAKAGGPGSLSMLLGRDNGVVSFGSGVVTSEKMIQTKPDLVRRFMRAYLQAFAETIKDPGKTADAIIAAAPEYKDKKDVLVAQLRADIAETFMSPATKQNGLGYMSPQTAKATVDLLVSQGVLKETIDTTKAFDNQFIGPTAPKM